MRAAQARPGVDQCSGHWQRLVFANTRQLGLQTDTGVSVRVCFFCNADATLMIFGKTVLQGLPMRVTLSLWAFIQRGYWGPPIHNMGSCGRFRESPNTWKHFGPEPTQAQYSVISESFVDGKW